LHREEVQLGMLNFKFSEMESLFSLLDVNKDGSLNIWELTEGLNRLGGQATRVEIYHLEKFLESLGKRIDTINDVCAVQHQTSSIG